LLAQVQQISANLQSARANVTYQKSNYERHTELYNVGAISKAEVEAALYQYQSAGGTVSSILAQLSSAQKNLSFANIYSPIDGTVLSRSVSEGQTVAASLSTPTLFSIAKDLSKMQVQASVDEADIGNVTTGLRVEFTVDAYPADTFHGTVKEIRLRPTVSSNVVTYTTIIDAPNNELKLKPGMTASIIVYTREVDSVLLVPSKAIAFQPDSVLAKSYTIIPGKPGTDQAASTDSAGNKKGSPGFVWLLKDNNIIRKAIMTGMDDETQVQIVSGLKPGDEIVTGYQQVAANKKSTAKSPFMPTRTGGTRRTGTVQPR
jgi:HlyD family secretion protein